MTSRDMESLGSILKRIAGRATENPAHPDAAEEHSQRGPHICDTCHGAGWVSRKRPVGHPEFGQGTACPKCREKQGSERRTGALRRYSRLGNLEGATFATTIVRATASGTKENGINQQVLRTAEEYADTPVGWLVLTGPPGSGKTHLAAAFANRRIEMYDTALFITVPDLLDHLRSAYAPDAATGYDRLFEQVRNAPMLILDEMGAHSATPWAQEKLFQILNHRRTNNQPTVVTVRGMLSSLDETLRTRLTQPEVETLVLQLGPFTARSAREPRKPPARLAESMTLNSFDPKGAPGTNATERRMLEMALNAATEYAKSPDGWLLINGSPGAGKTHLAVAVSETLSAKGTEAMYAFVPALLDELRATQRPDSEADFEEIMQEAMNAGLLVLDDLGAENTTPWTQEKLLRIAVHRHDRRLPTVITTSCTMDELESASPRLAARLVDAETVQWIPMQAPNYRAAKGSR